MSTSNARFVAPSHRACEITPCPHGSVGDAELRTLGLARGDVLDFSASTNPCAPSPRVWGALAAVDLGRYPDDEASELRAALAARIGLPADWLLAGNGSSELFWLLALAYLDPGDAVLVVGPTYGEYARAARMLGARVTEWRAEAANGFQPDLAAVCAVIDRLRPKLTFLCNPNNPTGVLLDRPAITRLLVATPGLLVIDEAYAGFVESPQTVLDLIADGRCVVVRSLTKDYALAGLRLGYVVAVPAVIAALRAVRPPWSVSAAAQAAGVAALSDDAHLHRSLAEVRAAKAYLLDALPRLVLRVLPSAANFLLVEVGDGRRFRERLLRRGCCVRDCASFGLPTHVRVGVRTLAECRRLVAAIASTLAAEQLGDRTLTITERRAEEPEGGSNAC